MALVFLAACLLALALGARGDNITAPEGGCAAEDGPWGCLLEQWATDSHAGRQGRIMSLPPAPGYYVIDRVDRPPPPPLPAGPSPYSEWIPPPPPPPAGSKIVNRPTNPNKDKFKPSPSYPMPPQQGLSRPPPPPLSPPRPPVNPHRGPGPAADRIDEPPKKQVTETDLYLLTAIEKLVFRVDLMEKRLRKVEESLHYVVAGSDNNPEPCAGNFTRLGSVCYHMSEEALDWKGASLRCRKMGGFLAEPSGESKRRLQAALLADKGTRGIDVWTGGLNPGLLWIWSHSARPAAGNDTDTPAIAGEGRCLAWLHDPAINSYVFRGQDCVLRHRYICEKEDDKAKLGNEIQKVARQLRDTPRQARELLNLISDKRPDDESNSLPN